MVGRQGEAAEGGVGSVGRRGKAGEVASRLGAPEERVKGAVEEGEVE